MAHYCEALFDGAYSSGLGSVCGFGRGLPKTIAVCRNVSVLLSSPYLSGLSGTKTSGVDTAFVTQRYGGFFNRIFSCAVLAVANETKLRSLLCAPAIDCRITNRSAGATGIPTRRESSVIRLSCSVAPWRSTQTFGVLSIRLNFSALSCPDHSHCGVVSIECHLLSRDWLVVPGRKFPRCST